MWGPGDGITELSAGTALSRPPYLPIYGVMAFAPRYRLIPRIIRQIKAIERTTGMIEAVRMKPEWISDVRAQAKVREALASVQIEGSSLTLEQAFALADEVPARDLHDSEREFCNYLHAFGAIEDYRGERDVVLQKGDLLNLHKILMDGVRGGERFAGQFRREGVEVGDRVGDSKTVHHTPPNWSEVENEVDQLLDWIEVTKTRGDGEDDPWVHAAIQAGIAHHRLVWIHPFVDGIGGHEPGVALLRPDYGGIVPDPHLDPFPGADLPLDPPDELQLIHCKPRSPNGFLLPVAPCAVKESLLASPTLTA